jgi:O-methyltransferase
MRVYEDVPLFSPWHGYGQFGDAFRRSGAINYYCLYYIDCVLRQALKSSQARYEIWELGVWQGASAMFLATMAKDFGRKLRLFDTFKGIPAVNPEHDGPLEGMFSDTSLEQVKNRIEPVGAEVTYHEGLIPGTFSGRENDVVAFAHVALDIYDPILASCEFIYPRLMPGGAIVFDDYGWVNCPGARAAVEEYFAERNESIICVPTGQAFIIKSCS